MAIALRAVVLGLAAAAARCVVRIELSRAGGKSPVAKQSAPNASVVSLVDDLKGIKYTAALSVGTPGQIVQVALSLVHDSTWVPGVPPLAADATHSYYAPSASSTYERVDRIFSTDDVAGDWARDTVSLGSLRMEGFEFGVAEQWGKDHSTTDSEPFPTQGSMGLGLSEGGSPTVLRELVKAEQIPAPVFACHFGEEGADLSLGGPAEDYDEGDFHFVSLANAPGWSVALDGVKHGLGSQWMAAPGWAMFVQQPVIMGPSEIITPFLKEWEAAGATKVSEYQITAPCETQGPSLHFKIDGRRYTLGPKDLLVSVESVVCMLPVFVTPAPGGVWGLGLPFLKKYYTLFDAAGEKRVGFALAKPGADNFV